MAALPENNFAIKTLRDKLENQEKFAKYLIRDNDMEALYSCNERIKELKLAIKVLEKNLTLE